MGRPNHISRFFGSVETPNHRTRPLTALLAMVAWAALTVVLGPAVPAAAQSPAPLDPISEPLWERVVIDPGHGGDDLGVVGPGGFTESAFTLALARQLKNALETEFGVQAVLTRDEGQNPDVSERTAVANRMRADLFISLHAGGAYHPSWSGYDVLYQDYRLQVGLIDPTPPAGDAPDAPVSWDLAQAPHLDASRRLARELDRALGDVLRVKSRGPSGLPLAVLAGADRPAVLLELGYLTNPEDERRLKSQGYRDALTRAILNGIKAWLR